jgi:hypothetical protein
MKMKQAKRVVAGVLALAMSLTMTVNASANNSGETRVPRGVVADNDYTRAPTVQDALAILRFLVGLPTILEEGVQPYVFRDGNTRIRRGVVTGNDFERDPNVQDALAILRSLVGLESEISSDPHFVVPPNPAYRYYRNTNIRTFECFTDGKAAPVYFDVDGNSAMYIYSDDGSDILLTTRYGWYLQDIGYNIHYINGEISNEDGVVTFMSGGSGRAVAIGTVDNPNDPNRRGTRTSRTRNEFLVMVMVAE